MTLFTPAPLASTVARMVARLLSLLLLAATMLATAMPPARARATSLLLVVPDAQVADAVRASLAGRLPPLGLALRIASVPPARRSPPPDLLLVRDADLAPACTAGTLRPLEAHGSCGVAGPVEQIVLGWDERRDAGTPTWRDLWELARLPGKRGLPRRAAGTLEIALLADGVAPGDIYRTLGSKEGLDRAFRKLDQLAPYVVWWTDGADAVRALRSSAVLITVAPAAALVQSATQHPGLGLQWADSLGQRTSWAIPDAAPNPEAARRVLALLREPAVAAAIDAAGSPPVPPGARHLVIDDAFWAQHQAIETRFALWLGR